MEEAIISMRQKKRPLILGVNDIGALQEIMKN